MLSFRRCWFLVVCLCLLVCCFGNGVSLCSSGYSETHSAEQVTPLTHKSPPAFISPVLALKAHITASGSSPPCSAVLQIPWRGLILFKKKWWPSGLGWSQWQHVPCMHRGVASVSSTIARKEQSHEKSGLPHRLSKHPGVNSFQWVLIVDSTLIVFRSLFSAKSQGKLGPKSNLLSNFPSLLLIKIQRINWKWLGDETFFMETVDRILKIAEKSEQNNKANTRDRVTNNFSTSLLLQTVQVLSGLWQLGTHLQDDV